MAAFSVGLMSLMDSCIICTSIGLSWITISISWIVFHWMDESPRNSHCKKKPGHRKVDALPRWLGLPAATLLSLEGETCPGKAWAGNPTYTSFKMPNPLSLEKWLAAEDLTYDAFLQLRKAGSGKLILHEPETNLEITWVMLRNGSPYKLPPNPQHKSYSKFCTISLQGLQRKSLLHKKPPCNTHHRISSCNCCQEAQWMWTLSRSSSGLPDGGSVFGKQQRGKPPALLFKFFKQTGPGIQRQHLKPAKILSTNCLWLSAPPLQRVQLCVTILCYVLSTAPILWDFINGPGPTARSKWQKAKSSTCFAQRPLSIQTLAAPFTARRSCVGQPWTVDMKWIDMIWI